MSNFSAMSWREQVTFDKMTMMEVLSCTGKEHGILCTPLRLSFSQGLDVHLIFPAHRADTSFRGLVPHLQFYVLGDIHTETCVLWIVHLKRIRLKRLHYFIFKNLIHWDVLSYYTPKCPSLYKGLQNDSIFVFISYKYPFKLFSQEDGAWWRLQN